MPWNRASNVHSGKNMISVLLSLLQPSLEQVTNLWVCKVGKWRNFVSDEFVYLMYQPWCCVETAVMDSCRLSIGSIAEVGFYVVCLLIEFAVGELSLANPGLGDEEEVQPGPSRPWMNIGKQKIGDPSTRLVLRKGHRPAGVPKLAFEFPLAAYRASPTML